MRISMLCIYSLLPSRPVSWLGLSCFMGGKLSWHCGLAVLKQFLQVKEHIRVLQPQNHVISADTTDEADIHFFRSNVARCMQ